MLYLSYFMFPSDRLLSASLPLAGCLVVCGILSLAAAAARSGLGRYTALTLHLSTALAWLVWFEASNQMALSPENWGAFAVCAFVGAVLSDCGVCLAMTETVAPVLEKIKAAAESGRFHLRPLSSALESGGFKAVHAFESGGFRAVTATDSGSFRVL
jgi:hypothetical protein